MVRSEMERDSRRLAAALYAWGTPPFKLWARVRAHELARKGEGATIVIWWNERAFDAAELELAGEPEYAVRRASGTIERSPHSPSPPETKLRLVYKRPA